MQVSSSYISLSVCLFVICSFVICNAQKAMAMAADGSHMSDSSNIWIPSSGAIYNTISAWRSYTYVKLPVREFFRYRSVCKEWYRLAGDREFLEESFKHRLIPEPYFFLESWFGGQAWFLRCWLVTGLWSTSWLPSDLQFVWVVGMVIPRGASSVQHAWWGKMGWPATSVRFPYTSGDTFASKSTEPIYTQASSVSYISSTW